MGTVSVNVANSVLGPAADKGVDRVKLLAQVGLDPEKLKDPDNRIHGKTLGALVQAATELSGDDNFPLYWAKNFQPEYIGLVRYIVMYSPSLREGFISANKYMRIIGDTFTYHLADTGDITALEINILDDDVLPYKRFMMEGHMARLAMLFRELFGKKVNPISVHFEHNVPSSRKALDDFFNCDIEFAAPQYKLRVPKSLMDSPIAMANPQLNSMLLHQADELLATITDSETMGRKVSKEVMNLISKNEASLENVAKCIGVRERTIQRQLKMEGYSFNELRKNVRIEMANQYLLKRDFSISEIAYLLGFSEPSAFHRFFKKLTGKTPKSFRLG